MNDWQGNEGIQDRKGMRARITGIFALLLAVLFLLIFLNVSIGSFHVSLGEVFKAVARQGGASTQDSVIWLIRLPRMSAAVILGGALALSGFLLQTFFNNPIAGPYVLGISSGAKLTVAIVMVTVFGAYESVSSGF